MARYQLVVLLQIFTQLKLLKKSSHLGWIFYAKVFLIKVLTHKSEQMLIAHLV